MLLDDRHHKTSTSLWWIGLSVAFSVAVHALGVVLTRFTGGWVYPDEPLHSFVETAGSVTGLGVALLLVLMDRLGRGSTSNVPLVFGLGTMAVLDALHAVVPPGQNFVWLHSTATFAGGLLFASVWVSPRGRRGYVLNSTVAALLVLGTLLLPLSPYGAPRMVVDGQFTWAAVFLNIGGGVLMLAAAGRYLWHYARSSNADDLLFAVHCLLFGGAAIMFEQSALWDFSWWWWHMLRLIAYVVALTFAVRTVMQLQIEVQRQADRAQSRYEKARSVAFEATNESERLREALDKHTLYSVTDRSGKIVDVNEGFCRISGYSREELLGQNHRIINSGVHPRSFWVEVWRTIASGEAWRGEVCNRAKDGSLYWVDATMVPWIGPDGRPERYISLRFDITDAKRVAEERERLADRIAAQEQLLQTVIDSVSDAIVAEDEHGNFLLFNQAATDLFVENPGVMAPSGWDELPTQYRTDGESPLGEEDLPTRRALKGEEVLNQELVVRRGDGDRRVSCNATRLASDSHQGAVVSLRDVTEVEQMRRQLQQAQKLESIGQLAAGVAHEINTPLQSVIANVSFLGEAQPRIVETIEEVLRLIDPKDQRAAQPGAAREVVERARCNYLMEQSLLALDDLGGASRKVSEIVRAMKNVAHPGSVEHTYFDLNEVLRDAATITCNRWKGAAELTLELDEGLPNAFGSHAEISQVAINLIVNAADALEELHGESGDSGAIVIRSELAEDGSAVFRIADNGAGIPTHIVARVFDPFFTTKEVGKGSGQGLAISYDIVTNRHNGSIKVDSRPGDGAEFTITLPTAAPVTETRAEHPVGHLDSAAH